jgi:hypothetical protein
MLRGEGVITRRMWGDIFLGDIVVVSATLLVLDLRYSAA